MKIGEDSLELHLARDLDRASNTVAYNSYSVTEHQIFIIIESSKKTCRQAFTKAKHRDQIAQFITRAGLHTVRLSH